MQQLFDKRVVAVTKLIKKCSLINSVKRFQIRKISTDCTANNSESMSTFIANDYIVTGKKIQGNWIETKQNGYIVVNRIEKL